MLWARKNDRGLIADRGHWVRNGDTFVVAKVTKTSITATGQGRTVDHSLLVIAEDDTPDRAGVYTYP